MAFSVITNLRMDLFEALISTHYDYLLRTAGLFPPEQGEVVGAAALRGLPPHHLQPQPRHHRQELILQVAACHQDQN